MISLFILIYHGGFSITWIVPLGCVGVEASVGETDTIINVTINELKQKLNVLFNFFS